MKGVETNRGLEVAAALFDVADAFLRCVSAKKSKMYSPSDNTHKRFLFLLALCERGIFQVCREDRDSSHALLFDCMSAMVQNEDDRAPRVKAFAMLR